MGSRQPGWRRTSVEKHGNPFHGFHIENTAITRHSTMRPILHLKSLLLSLVVPFALASAPAFAGNPRVSASDSSVSVGTEPSSALAFGGDAVAVGASTVGDMLDRGKEIKFEGGTTKFAEASLAFLDDLAAALLREPGVRLEIVCHTFDSGDAKRDMTLSKRRSEAVKYYLVGKGVSTDQLIATGRGAEDPISPNITRTGRMRNERVELHRAAPSK
jgi:outer membrane protein OmpA-like peptidoglycan-associated protein